MDNENGIVIAMSPVQMAAALSDKSVSEGETMSNRLHGGLGLAGGVAEMFGAGAMCIVPEPTMLTKAGCVIVGTHGLDTIQAALRQVWSGRAVATDTYNSAVALGTGGGFCQTNRYPYSAGFFAGDLLLPGTCCSAF